MRNTIQLVCYLNLKNNFPTTKRVPATYSATLRTPLRSPPFGRRDAYQGIYGSALGSGFTQIFLPLRSKKKTSYIPDVMCHSEKPKNLQFFYIFGNLLLGKVGITC